MKVETISHEYRICMQGIGMRIAVTSGCIEAKGPDFLDLINRISTNNLETLVTGQGTSTVLTSEKGRIIDVLGISSTPSSFLLLTGPSNEQDVIQWIDKFVFMEDLSMENLSDQFCLLNIMGPASGTAIKQLTGEDVTILEPFFNKLVTISGKDIRVIRTDFGPIESYLLLVPHNELDDICEAVVSVGGSWIGETTWDTIRILNGLPLFGREISELYNPLEVGLEEKIDFNKGCYIGQEVIARLDTYKKVQKRLVNLLIDDPSFCDPEHAVYLNGKVVGQITSMAKLPNNSEYIALAFLRVRALAEADSFALTCEGLGRAQLSKNPSGLRLGLDPPLTT